VYLVTRKSQAQISFFNSSFLNFFCKEKQPPIFSKAVVCRLLHGVLCSFEFFAKQTNESLPYFGGKRHCFSATRTIVHDNRHYFCLASITFWLFGSCNATPRAKIFAWAIVATWAYFHLLVLLFLDCGAKITSHEYSTNLALCQYSDKKIQKRAYNKEDICAGLFRSTQIFASFLFIDIIWKRSKNFRYTDTLCEIPRNFFNTL